jgi:hypothetical protein
MPDFRVSEALSIPDLLTANRVNVVENVRCITIKVGE